MTAYGNCSKNYIDCRKHPTRTGNVNQRLEEDAKNYLTKLEKQKEANNEIFTEADSEDSKVSASALKKAKKLSQDILDQQIALQSHTSFKDWTKKQERNIANLKARKQPSAAATREFNKITKLREDLLADMKSNIEKEIALENAAKNPLEGFKLAVTNLLVKEGQAYDSSSPAWGDSRGHAHYSAGEHIRENCKPAMIKNYQEDYSWSLSDTYNRDDYVGIKADISCACGQVHNTSFIMENTDFSSLMSKLMNS